MVSRTFLRSLIFPLVSGWLWIAVPGWAQDLVSQPSERKDVSLTVYSKDLGLVRERRQVPVQRGVFRLRYEGVTSGIDPTSVHLETVGRRPIRIVEQNYEYDLISQDRLLQKYIGREVGYRREDGTIGGARLLAANQGYVYELDGRITFELPGPIVLEAVPEGLSANPTLVWTLEADRDGTEEVDTAYLTSGLSWRADYVLLLEESEKTGGLNGWVTLDNTSGASFDNAQLKLVAGDVKQVQPMIQGVLERGGAAYAKVHAPQFQEEAFFEYHLYTLERRTDIDDRQQKQILFFDSDRVKVEKSYTFQSSPHYFVKGFVPPEGSEHVEVNLRFENSSKNGLGKPIPAGVMRVFKKDRGGAPQFLGENRVRHTPKDETLEFAVGKAFDLVGEHVQTDYVSLGRRTSQLTYEVELRNHKTEAVEIRVLENFRGDWVIEESSHPHHKQNASTARFDLQVPADGKVVLDYRVRITN